MRKEGRIRTAPQIATLAVSLGLSPSTSIGMIRPIEIRTIQVSPERSQAARDERKREKMKTNAFRATPRARGLHRHTERCQCVQRRYREEDKRT